jgi:hypothetical protein
MEEKGMSETEMGEINVDRKVRADAGFSCANADNLSSFLPHQPGQRSTYPIGSQL